MNPTVNPVEVAAQVRRALGLTRCRVAGVLGVRAGASLVVALDTDAGRVVAKVTADGGADRSARALAALAGLAPGPLRVPRLVLHDRGARLVVVEHVGGASAATLLDAAAPLRLTGRALAALHHAPFPVGPHRTAAGHLADLVRPHPRELVGAAPELAAVTGRVLAAVADADAAAGPPRPVHRDLHPRQMLVGRAAVTLLDWDLAAMGDPALDVGNLRAHLRYRRPDVAGRAITAFTDGYAGTGDPAVLRRAHRYEAFACLRLACKRWRLDGPAGLPAARALLDAAGRVLDGEVAGVRD